VQKKFKTREAEEREKEVCLMAALRHAVFTAVSGFLLTWKVGEKSWKVRELER